MRRHDSLEELPRCGTGRREGTGPPPPAARVLRIALRATALRAALAPGASGGPAGQQSGQPQGAAPDAGRGALPPGAGTPAPSPYAHRNGGILAEDSHDGPQAYTCSIMRTGRKITRMAGSQQQS